MGRHPQLLEMDTGFLTWTGTGIPSQSREVEDKEMSRDRALESNSQGYRGKNPEGQASLGASHIS